MKTDALSLSFVTKIQIMIGCLWTYQGCLVGVQVSSGADDESPEDNPSTILIRCAKISAVVGQIFWIIVSILCLMSLLITWALQPSWNILWKLLLIIFMMSLGKIIVVVACGFLARCLEYLALHKIKFPDEKL